MIWAFLAGVATTILCIGAVMAFVLNHDTKEQENVRSE